MTSDYQKEGGGSGCIRSRIFHRAFVFTFMILFGGTALYAQPNLNFKRVTVNWPTIELYVAVGCNSMPAYDMTAQDFRITDNGKDVANFSLDCPNPAQRCAMSVGLAFDASGSMAGAGNAGAIAGGRSFIDIMDGVADEASVVYFNSSVQVAQSLTTSKAQLRAAVDSLPVSGQTAVWDGGHAAVLEVLQGSNPCRAVILLSDGADNSSSRTVQEIVALATQNHVRVFTIGLGPASSVTELETLALLTGGRYYQTPNAAQLTAVYQEIATIIMQSFQECRLTYDADCADGNLHQIALTLQNFCAGTDQKTKNYIAPLDSNTFTPLRIGSPDTAAYGGSSIVVPIELRTALNGEMLPPLMFTVRGESSCTLGASVSVPPGSLLYGVPVSVSPIAGGFRVATSAGKALQGTGPLMYVTLQLKEVQDTTCCDLRIEDVQFASGCFAPVIEPGTICVLPRVPVLNCVMDAPRALAWKQLENSYDPDPFMASLRVFNTGGATGINGRYRITYDTSALKLVSPQATVVAGSPPDILPGNYSDVSWQLTPRYRTVDDSTVICIEGMFENHTEIDCCVKVFIPRADTDLRCTLTAEDITVDTLQQMYEPDPFLLSATVNNHGSTQIENLAAEIILPPELTLAGADAPDQYVKPVTPASLAAQTTGVAAWELSVALPWPVTAADVPVTVRTVSGGNDTTVCRIMVHIPAMAFPFSFRLQADGPTTFCEGSSVLLDAGEGYISYLWSNLAATQIVTVRSSGMYYCQVIDQGGLIGYSDTVQVTVLPAPQPAIRMIGSSPLCAGDTLTLEADPGYLSYLWSTGDSTRSITVTRGGSYTVTVVDADGCPGASDAVSVTTLPAPDQPLVARSGDVLTSSHADRYQWKRNSSPIPGATKRFYQMAEIGSYTVEVTDSNGCSAESLPIEVTVLEVKGLPSAVTALDLYPNPAMQSVTIFLQLRTQSEALIELHDMLGRRVLQRQIVVDALGAREVLSLDGLQPGMYFVRVTVDGSHIIRPLLRSRQ